METAHGPLGDTTSLKIFGLFPEITYFKFASLKGEIALFSHLEQAHYAVSGANQIEILRIPLTHDSKKKAQTFWEISYQHKWLREHQNAMRTAYGKSPFYEYYDYKIWNILDTQIPSFKSLQESVMALLLPWLGLEELPIIILEPEASRHYFRSIQDTHCEEYSQVFENKFGHRNQLSVLDLLFNIGPECASYFRH